MKKLLIGMLGMALVFAMCATSVSAAGGRAKRHFIDSDGDGICDFCDANHQSCLNLDGMAFVDADGDGICDNCDTYHRCGTAGTGCGKNFVDTNNDGICDNYGTGQGRGNGCHAQTGRGNGCHGRRNR